MSGLKNGSTPCDEQRSRVASVLGIDMRKNERGPTLILFLYAMFLFACFYAVKVIRQSLFVHDLGARYLPYVYLVAAVCSYPLLKLYGRMLDALRRHHLLIATSIVLAISTVGFYGLFRIGGPWVAIAFYIWMGLAFGLAVSQFWSYANQIFDARQGKRLFSLIAVGCNLGGIVGGQLVILINHLVGIEEAILVVGALLLVLIGLICWCEKLVPAAQEKKGKSFATGEQARGGLQLVLKSPYLRLIALLVCVSTMVFQVVDLQFTWAIEQSTQDPAARTVLFSHLYSLISFAALVFQLLLTARVHRSLGVGVALRFLPVTIILGTVALLMTAPFATIFLIAAMGLKIGEGGFRHSIDQVTRELLFLPVALKIRQKAKAYIDVFVQRFSRGLAALLLLPVTFNLMTPVQLGWLSLVLGLEWLLLTVVAYRHYIIIYREGLEAGTIDPNTSLDLSDVTTLELLVQSLGSAQPHQVIYGIDLLSAGGRGRLVPPLMLYHENSEVRLRVLQIMANEGRRDAEPLINKCFGDDNSDVRAQAVKTMAQIQGEGADEALLPLLRNPDPRVRATVISYLTCHENPAYDNQARETLTEMLGDADPAIRAEAAKAIGDVPEPCYQNNLIQLLYDNNPKVVSQAVHAVRSRAMRSSRCPFYLPTLISLMRDRRIKHDCREALVAMGEITIPALAHFMSDPHEHIWVRRAAPKTIAQIGGKKAASALINSLGDRDNFLHRKVIEALVRLRSSLVKMDFGADRIRQHIRNEAHYYLQYLADLHGVGLTERGTLVGPSVIWQETPTLLQQILAERMRERLVNLFGLVALLSPLDHIRASLKGLLARKPSVRSHAIEYLDNALSGEVHRHVMCVINDAPVLDKLNTAGRLFGIMVRSQNETFQRVATAERGIGTTALTAAAVHAIYAARATALYPLVERINRDSGDEFVRETAHWVLQKLELVPAKQGFMISEDRP